MNQNTRFELSGDPLFGNCEPMSIDEMNDYLLHATKAFDLYGWSLSVEQRGEMARVTAEFIGDFDDSDVNPRAFAHWNTAAAPNSWWMDFDAVQDEMITASEAESLFGLKTGTVRQVCTRTPDELKARKSGKTWLVSRAACEARWVTVSEMVNIANTMFDLQQNQIKFNQYASQKEIERARIACKTHRAVRIHNIYLTDNTIPVEWLAYNITLEAVGSANLYRGWAIVRR